MTSIVVARGALPSFIVDVKPLEQGAGGKSCRVARGTNFGEQPNQVLIRRRPVIARIAPLLCLPLAKVHEQM